MTISLNNIDQASTAFDGSSPFGASFGPSLSLDGTKLVFESFADNLIPNDFNGLTDVFMRDLVTGTTTRISEFAGGAEVFSDTMNAQISGDGSTVVFESLDGGYVGNDFNGQTDVFVKDLATGNVQRASLRFDGTEMFNMSFDASVSNDGRYVAFTSFEDNVTPNDFNGFEDIFVRDMQTGQVFDVSSIGQGGVPSDGSAFNGQIAGNGQFVVFESMASNLVANDFNFQMDVFIRDLAAGTTEKVSQSFDGLDAMGDSFNAAVSDDGRYVAFMSMADNIAAGDNNGFPDVFLTDRDTGTTVRISDAMTGSGLPLGEVSISPDGTLVTYNVFDPINPRAFVYDQTTGMTQEIANAGFNGETDFSSDNTILAFGADIDGIVPDDTNGLSDVFVAETGIEPPPPAEEDGLFTDGDDTADLNDFDLLGDDIGDFTHAKDGADTVVLSEDSIINMPFFGGGGNDMIIGSSGNNFISGDEGNDTILGDGGDDGLVGGAGIDMIFGGEGDDDILGNQGDDRLFGEMGDDNLSGGGGNDQLTGGTGFDTFWQRGGDTGDDRIRDFTSGEDTLALDGVLDIAGNIVGSFQDLDTDFNGMLDGNDASASDNGSDLVLNLLGGSITFDNLIAIAQSDVAVV